MLRYSSHLYFFLVEIVSACFGNLDKTLFSLVATTKFDLCSLWQKVACMTEAVSLKNE